jgi:hypothetical protein
MLWSWYLADDTQFYVLGCMLLILAVRSVLSSNASSTPEEWAAQWCTRLCFAATSEWQLYSPLYSSSAAGSPLHSLPTTTCTTQGTTYNGHCCGRVRLCLNGNASANRSTVCPQDYTQINMMQQWKSGREKLKDSGEKPVPVPFVHHKSHIDRNGC